MTTIGKEAARLAELQRVRANLMSYSHPDDVAQTFALALKYIGGTTQKQAVVDLLVEGLDGVIARAKDKVREALE